MFKAKGQAVLIDLVLGMFLFLLVFGAYFTLWASNTQKIYSSNDLQDAREKGFIVMDSLIKGKGTPVNWPDMNIFDVNQLGLAESDRKISEEKAVTFSNLSAEYVRLKELLGVGPYEFYFELRGTDTIQAGVSPGANQAGITVRRIVEYKESEAIAELVLYKA